MTVNIQRDVRSLPPVTTQTGVTSFLVVHGQTEAGDGTGQAALLPGSSLPTGDGGGSITVAGATATSLAPADGSLSITNVNGAAQARVVGEYLRDQPAAGPLSGSDIWPVTQVDPVTLADVDKHATIAQLINTILALVPSSSGGTPTVSVAAATLALMRALSAGSRYNNPRVNPVQATPPAVTISATAPAAPFAAYSAWGGPNQGAVNYYGGPVGTLAGRRTFNGVGVASGTPTNQGWRVQATIDSAKFYLAVADSGTAATWRLIIDGEYVSLTPFGAGITGALYICVDFSSVGGRRLRDVILEGPGTAASFGGVYVLPTEGVYKPAGPVLRAALVGDSFTSSGAGYVWDCFGGVLCDMLGLRDYWNLGASGCGVVANAGGTGTTALQRLADLTTAAPDVIFLANGHADSVFTPAAVQSATASYLAAIRSAPATAQVPIFVLGVLSGNSNSDGTMTATELAIAAAVTALADPATFFLPVCTDPNGRWMTGSGSTAAPAGDGNSDIYVGANGVWPSTAGHAFLGEQADAAITNQLGKAQALAIVGTSGSSSGSGSGSNGETIATVAASGAAQTITLPVSGSVAYSITLTSNCTLSVAGGSSGVISRAVVRLYQGTGAPWAVTWPSNVYTANGQAVPLAQTAGRFDEMLLETWDNGATFLLSPGAFNAQVIAGASPPSSTPTPPAAPAITVSAGNAQASIAWLDGLSNGATITSHKIYRGTTAGSETLLASTSAASPYVDSTAANGTTYYYKATALNSAGESPQSNEVSVTPSVGTVSLGTHYLNVPGTTANDGVTTPATTSTANGGFAGNDLSVVACITAPTGTSSATIAAFFDADDSAALSTQCFAFNIEYNGKLQFFRKTSGLPANAESTVNPVFSGTTPLWLRADAAVSAGTTTFYTSTDGSAWTQLGATVAGLPTNPTNPTTTPLTIGHTSGTQYNNSSLNHILYFTLKVAGSVVCNVDFSHATSGASTVTGATGEVYTLTGSGSIV